jgi:hypothetical protein
MVVSFRVRLALGQAAWVVGGPVPVPLQGRGEGIVEGCGLVAEGGMELGVVHDPAVGELVEGVQVLAQCGLGHADQVQGRASGGEDTGSMAGGPVEPLDDLPGGAGLGDGQVPDVPGGRGVGGQDDQAGGDIGGVMTRS